LQSVDIKIKPPVSLDVVIDGPLTRRGLQEFARALWRDQIGATSPRNLGMPDKINARCDLGDWNRGLLRGHQMNVIPPRRKMVQGGIQRISERGRILDGYTILADESRNLDIRHGEKVASIAADFSGGQRSILELGCQICRRSIAENGWNAREGDTCVLKLTAHAGETIHILIQVYDPR